MSRKASANSKSATSGDVAAGDVAAGPSRSIVWFRQDLRLVDNPALAAAAKRGEVIPVYILDDANAGEDKPGAASRVWLHHSLESLKGRLGGALCVMRGDAARLLPELVTRTGANAVFWNRCYEPWRTKRDMRIKTALRIRGIHAESFKALLLWEPWELLKDDSTPYRVFTPFYRCAMRHADAMRAPLANSNPVIANALFESGAVPAGPVSALGLLSARPWEARIMEGWKPGEAGAMERMGAFAREGLDGYIAGRDFMAANHVSRLSPHIHFGEISPYQMWQAAMEMVHETGASVEGFCRQLCWREFQTSLLHHNPELRRVNLLRAFDAFDWRDDDALLASWRQGRTGVPVVDAAMRELSVSGYMHNRMRMVVGSFLVKNLRIHWRHGEAWFWDRLLDADHANNAASWQWVAGCGADAAPYFRIFNPVLQARRFDADARYTRRYVPELAGLPDRHIHAPWLAPQGVLDEAGVRLGETYPRPVVDLGVSRAAALEAFGRMRAATGAGA